VRLKTTPQREIPISRSPGRNPNTWRRRVFAVGLTLIRTLTLYTWRRRVFAVGLTLIRTLTLPLPLTLTSATTSVHGN